MSFGCCADPASRVVEVNEDERLVEDNAVQRSKVRFVLVIALLIRVFAS